MTENKDLIIKGCYLDIKKLVDNPKNYGKIIKIANKILAVDEFQIKAWQHKLTAIILLGNFKGGVECLKTCKVLQNLIFEKAYCEYRLNNLEDAWNTVCDAPSDSPLSIKELQAQILYRLERFDECFAKYRELIKTTSDPFDQERLTNLSATCVQRIYKGSTELGPKISNDSSYEQFYNSALELQALGDIEGSLALLQQAEQLCRNALVQDGASESEIREEVAIIRIQQGHCLQILKSEKEALNIYNEVLKSKPDDPSLLAVINNNIMVINQDGNIFDAKKRIKAATGSAVEHKLSSRQKATIAVNNCLLSYFTNKLEIIPPDCLKSADKFVETRLAMKLVEAANLVRLKKVNESVETLKTYAKKHPVMARIATLSAVQILLEQKSFEQAIEVISSLEEKSKYCNGIVSTLVFLCASLNKFDTASKILNEAVSWHKRNKSPSTHMMNILQHATNFHLQNGNPKAAVDALLELRNRNPSNQHILARLISAYSQFDDEMAKKLSQELPDQSLVVDVDTKALEFCFGPKYSRKQTKYGEDSMPSLTPQIAKSSMTNNGEKRKKKKKIRLPKNIIPGETPDPERWIPKWQRKGFKKRRDRRVKDVMKGTQGGSLAAADKYDITKMAPHHKPQSYTSSPKAETGYKRNFQKKKGKKKKH